LIHIFILGFWKVEKIFFYQSYKYSKSFTYFRWDHHFGLRTSPLLRCRAFVKLGKSYSCNLMWSNWFVFIYEIIFSTTYFCFILWSCISLKTWVSMCSICHFFLQHCEFCKEIGSSTCIIASKYVLISDYCHIKIVKGHFHLLLLLFSILKLRILP
jgi:hypothetical protein